NDVWAVGYYVTSALQTLVEHWNGTAWSVVPSANPSTLDNRFSAVAAVSANDVCAVGQASNDDGSGDITVVEHWDGTSWSVVPSPNAGTFINRLNGVATVSANDVWALGYHSDGSASKTLVERWDGTSWSVVDSPNVGDNVNRLIGVVTAPTNCVRGV